MRLKLLLAVPVAAGLLFALSSCDEKFGEDLERFVNVSVGPLSVKFANADLRLRWQTAFNLTLSDTETTLLALEGSLSQIKPPTFAPDISVETGLDVMQQQADLLDELSGYESTIDDTIHSIDVAKDACTSDKVYRYAKLGDSGLESIAAIVLPDADLSVYASNNQGDTWSRNFSSWFGAVERREQQRKAHDAIKNYPNKVIQPGPLRDLSEKLCQQELATAAPRLALQRTALVSAKTSLQESEQAVIDSYRALEANVLPRSYEEILSRSGTKRMLLDATRPIVVSTLRNRLRLVETEIRNFQSSLSAGGDCHAVQNGISDYQDLLTETQLQLDAIQSRQRLADAEGDYQALRTLVATKKQGLAKLALSVSAHACRA